MINSLTPIIVDLSIVLGVINPDIYGQYIEHVQPEEKIIYGGVFELNSPLSDEKGIRKDVVEALKEMGIPVVRWPGGCFADTYHWRNGIGKTRIGHQNMHWGGWEPNLFGTDEYLHLCNLLEAKTYTCLNAGTGTAEEAAEWVKYCQDNGIEGGLWGIGNEMYGEWEAGHCSADEYVLRVLEFAEQIRTIDPDVKLVAVGAPCENWNKTVLEKTSSMIDYISVHMYAHSSPGQESDYFNVVGAPVLFEEVLKETIFLFQEYNLNSKIKIAVDEWNVRHMYGTHLDRKDPRNLQDAIFVAGVLNVFQRLCKDVTLANYVFMVNGHAPLLVRENEVLKSTLYYIFHAYQNLTYRYLIKTNVDSPVCNTMVNDIGGWGKSKELSIPLIDVSATTDLNGNLSISIINRGKEEINAKLELLGANINNADKIRIWTLSANSPLASNTWSQPDLVKPIITNIENIENISLKPHSVNFVTLRVVPDSVVNYPDCVLQ